MSLITFALLATQASTSSLYAVEIESDSRVEVEDRTISCVNPPKRRLRKAQPCDVDQWEARVVDEYPRRALGREKSGTVLVEVTVGPDGIVSRCLAASLKQTFGLSQIACKKVRQSARFSPATDEQSQAVEGIATLQIEYVLPEWPNNDSVFQSAEPINQKDWTLRIMHNNPTSPIRRDMSAKVGIRFMVSPSGRVDRCEVTEMTGWEGIGRAACIGMVRYARYRPALDKNGSALATTETMTFNFTDG